MSVKFKVLSAMGSEKKLAILLELPNSTDLIENLASQEYVTIEDLNTACNCLENMEKPIDWIKMIFDPTLAVDPTETNETKV